MEIKHTHKIYNTIAKICKCLDEGLTIEQVANQFHLYSSDVEMYQNVYASEEYQEFLALRHGDKEYEVFDPSAANDKSFNMVWRKWADPLNVLKADKTSNLYMLFFEYTSYLYNIRRYFLGTIKSICRRFWTEYDPCLPIDELLNKIKGNLTYKGLKAVRKVQLLDPWMGYLQYTQAWKHNKRNTLTEIETEYDIEYKAKWLMAEGLYLKSIYGKELGLGGMLYAERNYLPETGNRQYPYLYFAHGKDVAEIAVESNPRIVRGSIKDEYIGVVTKWVKDNLAPLERYWNQEIYSMDLLEEVRSIDGNHCFLL